MENVEKKFAGNNIEVVENNTNSNPETLPDKPGPTLVEMIEPDLANRPVEYYLYTDPDGSRYVVETPTDNNVSWASYQDDLH